MVLCGNDPLYLLRLFHEGKSRMSGEATRVDYRVLSLLVSLSWVLSVTPSLGSSSSTPLASAKFTEDMIYIPGGEFTRGTSKKEAARLARQYGVHQSLFMDLEAPRNKVYVKPFYIDRYEVTNRQYQAFVKVTGHNAPGGWNGTHYPEGQGDYPVTGMTWQDAKAYAEWAGKRLPTEMEWEKAARGADGRLYPWGNEWKPGACRMD